MTVKGLKYKCPALGTVKVRDLTLETWDTGSIGHNAGHGGRKMLFACRCGETHVVGEETW